MTHKGINAFKNKGTEGYNGFVVVAQLILRISDSNSLTKFILLLVYNWFQFKVILSPRPVTIPELNSLVWPIICL